MENINHSNPTNVIISGNNRKIIENGFFFLKKTSLIEILGVGLINNLIFYSLPNSKIALTASSSTITKFHTKYLNQSENEINLNSNYELLFEIDLRECIKGEYYIKNSHMFNFLLLFI